MPKQKQFPQIHLEMPVEIRKYVLRYQAHLKIDKCYSQYSLQTTIFTIIKEHEQLNKPRIFLK